MSATHPGEKPGTGSGGELRRLPADKRAGRGPHWFSPDGSQMPALGERSLRGMGAEWYFVPAILPWAGRGVMG
jgi:hypothetical protein